MDIQEMIRLNNWVVIGDITNTTKYAYKILEEFKSNKYLVTGVHPKGGENVFKTLKEVPYKIDAIDLCVNSKLGLEMLKEANLLGIKNILIQPGAESKEIIDYCREVSMNAIEDCALIQLKKLIKL